MNLDQKIPGIESRDMILTPVHNRSNIIAYKKIKKSHFSLQSDNNQMSSDLNLNFRRNISVMGQGDQGTVVNNMIELSVRRLLYRK